jgi:hypothetical protein
MKKLASSVLILVLIPFSFLRAQERNESSKDFFLYSVGNSHTWDFRPSADFLEIAKALDIEIKNGWHINCGQNLETIWNNPAQTCVELTEYGVYRDAIENHRWNAITLQTYKGGTGKAETNAVDEFLDFIASSMNKDCDVFIYCTWPKNTAEKLGDFNYSEAWLSDFQENDTLKTLSEKYFSYLEEAIGNYSDRIKVIPVGRVLYDFDQKAKSGELPGFSGSGELYRDAAHMNNVGRYIAGLTVFSQIFRIDPVVIPDFISYQTADKWPSDRELTSKQKEVIRKIISEVLNFRN